jgi:hypothetical protein
MQKRLLNREMKNISDNNTIYNLYTEMAFGIATNPQNQHTITRAELIDLIKQLDAARGGGTNFFSVTQVTPARSNKIPNYEPFVMSGLKQGKTYIAKVAQVNGIYNQDYQGKVNQLRAAEGKPQDFVARASSYNAVEGTRALGEKGGQLYLRLKPISNARSFAPQILRKNGDAFEPVDKAEVEQYLIKNNPGAYQGLEQSAEQFRMLSIDSIAAININGRDYVISDLDQMRKDIWKASGAPMPIEQLQQQQ